MCQWKRAYAVIIGLVVSAVTANPVLATKMTALGWKEHSLYPYFNTRAIVVAQLVRLRNEPLEAYLGFEVLAVVRGEYAGKWLMVPFPDSERHQISRPRHTDPNTLKVGRHFLLVLLHGGDALYQWIPLTGPDDRRTIDALLQAYRDVDRLRPDDPWKAVNSKDVTRQAAAILHAATGPIEARFTVIDEFLRKPKPTVEDMDLVSACLNSDIDNRRLIQIARIKVEGQRELFVAAQLRNRALRFGAVNSGPEWDELVLDAVLDEESVDYSVVESVLMRWSILASPRRLQAFIEQALPRPEQHPRAAVAAWNLAKQQKHEAANLVNKLAKACTDDRSRRHLDLAVRACRRTEEIIAEFQQRLQGAKAPERNQYLAELVSLGDPEAAREVLERPNSRVFMPNFSVKPDLQRAERWREIARRRLLTNSMADGNEYLNPAEALYLLRDPSLPDLLSQRVDHEYWGEYALQYLALTAQPRHRITLERFRADAEASKRGYALAGLARLGDREAMHDVCRMAFLGQDSLTRYLVTTKVLARIDRASLLSAWEAQGHNGDELDRLRYEYVRDRLKSPPSQSGDMPETTVFAWPAPRGPNHNLRVALALVVVCVLTLVSTFLAYRKYSRRRAV